MLTFLYEFFVGLFSLEILIYPVAALAVSAVFAKCYDWMTGRC